MKIIDEIYQLLFISSIVYIIDIIIDFFIKVYGRFKLNNDTKFILSRTEKLLLWFSITILISYLL